MILCSLSLSQPLCVLYSDAIAPYAAITPDVMPFHLAAPALNVMQLLTSPVLALMSDAVAGVFSEGPTVDTDWRGHTDSAVPASALECGGGRPCQGNAFTSR